MTKSNFDKLFYLPAIIFPILLIKGFIEKPTQGLFVLSFFGGMYILIKFSDFRDKKEKLERERQYAITETKNKHLKAEADKYLSQNGNVIFTNGIRNFHIAVILKRNFIESLIASDNFLTNNPQSSAAISDYLEINEKGFSEFSNDIRKIIEAKAKINDIPVSMYSTNIDKLKGRDFEKLIARHYELLGRKAEIVGGADDYGVDVVVYPKGNLDGLIIQCKRYKTSNKVSSSTMQKIRGATHLSEYNNYKPILITSSYATKNAKEYAHKSGVRVIEREELLLTLKETVLKPKNNSIVDNLRRLDINKTIIDFINSQEFKSLHKEMSTIDKMIKEATKEKIYREIRESAKEYNRYM